MRTGYATRLVWLAAFAAAMAYLESAVVVHLRTIYYPDGFDFPIKGIDAPTLLLELGREAATILMLVAVARLSTSSGWSRFACFAFLFGVWDIFYYVWLKVFLGWPESLLTWDILFLIPVVWIGPVLAPLLVSVLLVAGSIRAMHIIEAGNAVVVDRWDWAMACAGAALILATFMEDAASALSSGGVAAVLALVPAAFNWPVFLLGFGLMVAATVHIDRKSRSIPLQSPAGSTTPITEPDQ